MRITVDKDSLWKQYQLHVDLYKHYLELVVKFYVFYYAVTGGILSFYFSKINVSFMRYSLLFPIILSLGFGVFFIYSATLMKIVRDELNSIGVILELRSVPAVKVLSILLYISAVLLILVAIGLALLFYFHPIIVPNAS